jgi:nucleoside-diphosphate-sugar epimerase
MSNGLCKPSRVDLARRLAIPSMETRNVEKKVALVAGASGIVGRGIADYLAGLDDWDVVGLSRSTPEGPARARAIAVDLYDPRDSHEKLGALEGVTHVFFAAYLQRPTEPEQVEVNAGMLRNLVDAIEPGNPGLRHISLMEGAKAYGCQFGPYKTPARESDPRHIPPNFYYDQEDFLKSRQEGRDWTWSAIRPSLICGPGVGHPMNLLMVIAVYASICKELGLPLAFPGTAGAYSSIMEATDAVHLARATVWAATEPRCGNEVFNITNGDLFRWENLWPQIADLFGLAVGRPTPIPLAAMMADKGPVWDSMVKKYDLRPHPYHRIASWPFGEFVFRIDYDVISDTTKARLFGFHDIVDTEAMVRRMLVDLRNDRYIP